MHGAGRLSLSVLLVQSCSSVALKGGREGKEGREGKGGREEKITEQRGKVRERRWRKKREILIEG